MRLIQIRAVQLQVKTPNLFLIMEYFRGRKHHSYCMPIIINIIAANSPYNFRNRVFL